VHKPRLGLVFGEQGLTLFGHIPQCLCAMLCCAVLWQHLRAGFGLQQRFPYHCHQQGTDVAAVAAAVIGVCGATPPHPTPPSPHTHTLTPPPPPPSPHTQVCWSDGLLAAAGCALPQPQLHARLTGGGPLLLTGRLDPAHQPTARGDSARCEIRDIGGVSERRAGRLFTLQPPSSLCQCRGVMISCIMNCRIV